jgi:hypothetical protein
MPLFGGKKRTGPHLAREDSLSARPVLGRFVKLARAEDGRIVLQIPRRGNPMFRTVSRLFRLPPYKRVALDELGTFVIELCDGEHAVRDVVDKFAKRFKLNHRDAEVSVTTFLRTLARRSIIGLAIESSAEQP